jgi:amidohydrolase
VRQLIREIESEVFSIFSHLHQNPELSWEEHQTTEFLRQQLIAEGFQVTTFADCTGVVGEIGEGDLTVALRADMDALWQEVNGKWQANHSCGHDAHMTLVLGAIKLLKKSAYPFPGKFKVIFQPAEEKGTGALKMIEKGVIDDIDYLYGVHLRPIQELTSGHCSPAILHGAARFVTGEIRGRASHAARPHLGINVIEVAAALVQELGKIHTDPQVPATIKMTRLHTGENSVNTIPDHATFTLDLRAQTNQVIDQLHEEVERIAKGLSLIYGAKINLEIGARMAAAEVNPEAQSLLERAIISVIGESYLAPPIVTPGGEDFHFYTLHKQNLKGTMLGLGCDLHPGLHHPYMTFKQEDLLTGMQILATAVQETFAQGKK